VDDGQVIWLCRSPHPIDFMPDGFIFHLEQSARIKSSPKGLALISSEGYGSEPRFRYLAAAYGAMLTVWLRLLKPELASHTLLLASWIEYSGRLRSELIGSGRLSSTV
jgi:hypothetical protein